MARPRGSGLNVVRKRQSDGTTLDYFYDRRTKAFLGHDRAAAAAQVKPPDHKAHEDPNTVAHLIARYLARPEFKTKLAPRTQKLYRGYLDEMRTLCGHMLFRNFGTEAIEDIKAGFANQPRKANQIIALFRILLGYAVKLRLLRDNPALRPEMLATPSRTEIWSYADEDAFLAHAESPAIALAIMLLTYTAQRPSDVLAMTTNHITERDGRMYILLRQQKTGELMDLPLHRKLEPLIRARIAVGDGLLLVPSPTGLPWLYRNFARAWDAVRVKAGVDGKQRRDLRRTGVVRLAEAGATVPQIAAVTGWGIDYCQRIVDTYLPRRTEVAIGAIELWEKAPATDSKVVRLGLATRRRR